MKEKDRKELFVCSIVIYLLSALVGNLGLLLFIGANMGVVTGREVMLQMNVNLLSIVFPVTYISLVTIKVIRIRIRRFRKRWSM